MLLTNHHFVGFHRELIIIQGARASFRGESGRVQGQDRIHAWSEEEVLILQNHRNCRRYFPITYAYRCMLMISKELWLIAWPPSRIHSLFLQSQGQEICKE